MKPLKGTPGQGLFGATLGFFIGFAAVALFGPTVNKFKDIMHLTPLAAGMLVAMPALSGSLLRIPFAAWVDTTGGRKPFLVLLGLSILGMTGLWTLIHFLYPARLTPNLYPLLLVLGMLCGCGIATFSVGVAQVSYWHPKASQGRALGIFAGCGNLAPGIFSFLLPFALGAFGLAGSYLAWLGFLVVGAILYFITGRNSYFFQLRETGLDVEAARTEARNRGQEMFPAGNTLDSLRISAGVWRTWLLVAIYFTTFGGFMALTSWYPTYWSEYFKVTLRQAGMLTAGYSIIASLMRVFGGSVADRLGGEKTTLLSLLATLGGALMLSMSQSFTLSIAGTLCMALGMGVGNAAIFKLVPQEVPQAVGGAAGWVGGLGAFGGFAIPPIMGLFVKNMGSAGYARGFMTFVILSIISILLALWLRATRGAALSRLRPAPVAGAGIPNGTTR